MINIEYCSLTLITCFTCSFFTSGGNQLSSILKGEKKRRSEAIQTEVLSKSINNYNTPTVPAINGKMTTTNVLIFITASLMIVVLLGQCSHTNAALQDFEADSIERRSAEMAFNDDLAKQWLRQIIAVSL